MPPTPDVIKLSLDELREVTAFAIACADPALAIFEHDLPDDPRPRAAIEAAQSFAAGGKRTKLIRDCAWAALRAGHDARDANHPAAAEAARAALATAGAAYLHPLAKATQVKHITGSAAHTAQALELRSGNPTVADRHLAYCQTLATATVRAVLNRFPLAPPGGGRVGELNRRLDALLR